MPSRLCELIHTTFIDGVHGALSMIPKIHSDYISFNERFDEVTNRLYKNWDGRGAEAFEEDTVKIRQNIQSLYVQLKELWDTLCDCHELIKLADGQIGLKCRETGAELSFDVWIQQMNPSPGGGHPNMRQYAGSGGIGGRDFSDFNVVDGFDGFYFNQNHVPGLEAWACTLTALAIILSVRQGGRVHPNDIRHSHWINGVGANWDGTSEISGAWGFGERQILSAIYEQLSQGNAVIVRSRPTNCPINGGHGHTVAAIGIRQGADPNNLMPADILIVDPADGKIRPLSEAVGGLNLNGPWGTNDHALRIAN